jgi:hypothetical protein
VLTGKRFELKKVALAVEMGTEGSGGWVSIPTGEIIEVISGPEGVEDYRLITMVWDKRLFAIFAIELTACAREIKHRSAGAA